MRISIADGKLDTQCVLAIRLRSEIFDLLSRTEERFQAYIFTESTGLYLQLFFHKTGKSNTVISPILSRSDVIQKRMYYTIAERIKNQENMKIITNLLETPSVALNDTYMIKNELFIDFRFSSSKMHEIHEILSGYVGISSDFRIVSLTASRPMRARMEDLNRYVSLSVVKYSLNAPTDDPLVSKLNMLSEETVGEIVGVSIYADGLKVLVFSTTSLAEKGFTVISQKDNIYEAYFKVQKLMEMRKQMGEARIPRFQVFLSIMDGRLYVTTFVPTPEAEEYISILFRSLMGEPESKAALEYYSGLSDSLWDWI
ncbi:MAG: hypothetical protein ACP5OC_01835 [Thermoplasmata archaeon]